MRNQLGIGKSSTLLDRLRHANSQDGRVTSRTVAGLAEEMCLPKQHVEGVATFYSMLNRTDAPAPRKVIRVCDGPTCWLHGGCAQLAELQVQYAEDDDVLVERSSCIGQCDRAPAATVDGMPTGLQGRWVQDDVALESESAPIYATPRNGETRLLLADTDQIDPDSLDDAMAVGVYRGLERALNSSPEFVIEQIEAAQLRGRGGAAFPTACKWRIVREAQADQKYVICNADESEPLTFKDRVLMDANPHAVLEGMVLAGYAVGATAGIVYIRGEYEPQARRLEHAIQKATEAGWLGDNIQGRGFTFHVHVHRGAGAYICGEESALLESLEGRRGEPRLRPPFPATHGLYGFPTAVNNVETLAVAALVMRMGAEHYLKVGNPDEPGTRLHALQGHIRLPGLVELRSGHTLREMIQTFGGGMSEGSRFHFALTGGAAGSFVGEDLLDQPMTANAAEHGISLGSGGILVCDHSVTPPQLLREILHFFEVESCGKCTPCRMGTTAARVTIERLLQGQGTHADLDRLRLLADTLKQTSFCGLGTSAAEPIKTALDRFPSSFESLFYKK